MLGEPILSPLPHGMRDLLLNLLTLAYPKGAPQTRLSDAPDGTIAWQVQSMLDDFADADCRRAAAANDNSDDSPDPDDGWARAIANTRMGVAA
jgi:hypothetical protein